MWHAFVPSPYCTFTNSVINEGGSVSLVIFTRIKLNFHKYVKSWGLAVSIFISQKLPSFNCINPKKWGQDYKKGDGI